MYFYIDMDLESSTKKLGRYVNQIRHFSGWQKRTFEWIDTATIKDWTMCKMMCRDGRMLMVNVNNVDMIEVFPDKKDL